MSVETTVTIKKMNELITTLREHRDQKDGLKNELSLLEAKIQALEDAIRETLTACGLSNFKGNAGDVTLVEKSSVRVPKDPESKQAFFEYLRKRDMFDALATVNSQTLNSWYREEESLALERGEFDFKVPGIGEPSVYTELRLRRK